MSYRWPALIAIALIAVYLGLRAVFGGYFPMTPQDEIARLEKLLLQEDGHRCDACKRVFDISDGEYGEDCWLCATCANEARRPTAASREPEPAPTLGAQFYGVVEQAKHLGKMARENAEISARMDALELPTPPTFTQEQREEVFAMFELAESMPWQDRGTPAELAQAFAQRKQ